MYTPIKYTLPKSCRKYKDWRLKKETTFAFGHFMTISGHFITNYITIFHKKCGSDGHFEGLNNPQSQFGQKL